LLNLEQAGAYIGVKKWTVRDYLAAGLLPRVTLPALQPREGAKAKEKLTRTLIDVRDLDAFIERCKAGRLRELQSRAPGVNGNKSRPVVPEPCPDEVSECAR
jgi:hypothetical protein